MGDPQSRRHHALGRLRSQLRRKRESLADQFDFKMYIAFVFRDKRKRPALFEAGEVMPVMTNNYEELILKGVRQADYSLQSSLELLSKDVVQLHAPRYQSLRRDVIGNVQDMDFFLWPRKDIEKVVCLLFSRWKGSDDPYKLIQAEFEFDYQDYEQQLVRLLGQKDKAGLVVNNDTESMFLFVRRHGLPVMRQNINLELSVFENGTQKEITVLHQRALKSQKGMTTSVFKLCSICLYLPQDQLTHWGVGSVDDHLKPYLPD